jgi:ribosomal protein S18 acetylase RimI-like enzyme
MRVEAREAGLGDMETLQSLYRSLEREMTGLHKMWPVADGLDEPVIDSLRSALDDPDTIVLIGEVDGYPFGFLLARVERLIYVDQEAREVAVGEEMREVALGMLRERGITKFDAHVLPGHRLAKNFFESGGFSARSIIMHHDDDRE